jgi:hypothetical protein
VNVAAAILFGWWSIEERNTYMPGSPVLTKILRDAPTTPLLRLLKCSAWVSIPVLVGIFCALVQINAWLTGMLPVGKRGLQRLLLTAAPATRQADRRKAGSGTEKP